MNGELVIGAGLWRAAVGVLGARLFQCNILGAVVQSLFDVFRLFSSVHDVDSTSLDWYRNVALV